MSRLRESLKKKKKIKIISFTRAKRGGPGRFVPPADDSPRASRPIVLSGVVCAHEGAADGGPGPASCSPQPRPFPGQAPASVLSQLPSAHGGFCRTRNASHQTSIDDLCMGGWGADDSAVLTTFKCVVQWQQPHSHCGANVTQL